MDSLLWLILIVVFSVIELNTFNMVTIWFVVGSIFALIFSYQLHNSIFMERLFFYGI